MWGSWAVHEPGLDPRPPSECLHCAGRFRQSSYSVGRRRVAHGLSDRLGLAIHYGYGIGNEDAIADPDAQYDSEHDRKLQRDSLRYADALVDPDSQRKSEHDRKFQRDSLRNADALINLDAQHYSEHDRKFHSDAQHDSEHDRKFQHDSTLDSDALRVVNSDAQHDSEYNCKLKRDVIYVTVSIDDSGTQPFAKYDCDV